LPKAPEVSDFIELSEAKIGRSVVKAVTPGSSRKRLSLQTGTKEPQTKKVPIDKPNHRQELGEPNFEENNN